MFSETFLPSAITTELSRGGDELAERTAEAVKWDPALYSIDCRGNILRHLLKIGRAPPGLDTSRLN